MSADDNLRKPTKKYLDPNAVKDFHVDWSDWLVPTDSIASSSWAITVGDAALTVDSDSLTGPVATAWLSCAEGASGNYWATNHVVSAQGREDDQSIIITIKEM